MRGESLSSEKSDLSGETYANYDAGPRFDTVCLCLAFRSPIQVDPLISDFKSLIKYHIHARLAGEVQAVQCYAIGMTPSLVT